VQWFFHLYDRQWNKSSREEAISPPLNKVNKFVASPLLRLVLGQYRSGFDFRNVLDERKILSCDLPKGGLGPDVSQLIDLITPEDDRSGLPKVPACKDCNNKKSVLEHYCTVVLPFGSRHPTARKILSEKVSRRIENNLKLKNHLRYETERVWVKNEGAAVSAIYFHPFQWQKNLNICVTILSGVLSGAIGRSLSRRSTNLV
jgi:hypothetical protein